MAVVCDAHAYAAKGLLINQRDIFPSPCDGTTHHLARAVYVHANGENVYGSFKD